MVLFCRPVLLTKLPRNAVNVLLLYMYCILPRNLGKMQYTCAFNVRVHLR